MADSADSLLAKYGGDPAEGLLAKYAPPARKENILGRAALFVGGGILKGMEELSERSGRAIGGAMAPFFGQSEIDPVTGLVRGAVLKDQPRPEEIYRRAGFTESPLPEWARYVTAPGPYGGTLPIGAIGRAATTPEAAGLATELAGQAALDPLAALTVAPAARAAGRVLTPLRGVRGLAGLGNFFSRGFSIVNTADREAIRELLRSSRGVGHEIEGYVDSRLNEAEHLIRSAARQRGEDASTTERFVRDLVEAGHRDPELLARSLPEEGQAAAVLRELGDQLPEFRIRQGLRPAELMQPKPGEAPDPADFAREAAPWLRSAAKERGESPDAILQRLGRIARAGPPGRATVGETLTEGEWEVLDMLDAYREAGVDYADAVAAAQRAVRYTPRIPEERFSRVLGTGGGRRIGMSELAPRLPGKRATPAEMTTTELEHAIEQGAIRGTPVKRPLKPMLEAFEARGRGTARAAANARAINEIATRFGVDETAAKAGWRSLGELGILREYQPAVKAALSRTYVHPEVFRFMDDFAAGTTPPRLRGMNGFLKVWKPIVTTINPGFISRNFQWNGIVGWVFGNRNPRNWVEAAEAISGANPSAAISGFGKSQAALREELILNGITRSGYEHELAPSLVGRRIPRPGAERAARIVQAPARVGQRVNAAGEDLARASFYLAMRKGGMSPAEASKRTSQVYFDYTRDAFTRGENWLRENLIPFYAWTRRILPLTFRAMGERPAVFAQLGSIESASARAAGLKPGEVRQLGPELKSTAGVVLPAYPSQKPGEYRALPLTAIGFFDPTRLAQTVGEGPSRFVEQLVGTTAPPVKAFYEATFGKSTFTGRKNTGAPVRLPTWVGSIPAINRPLAEKLGIFKGPDGWYGPDYLYTVLSTPGPLASAAGDLYLAARGNRAAGARAIRWLTGVRVVEGLSPARTRRYERIGARFEAREEAGAARKARAKRVRLERKAAEGQQ